MIARKSALIVSTQFLSKTIGHVGLMILSKLWFDFALVTISIVDIVIVVNNYFMKFFMC